MTRSLNSRRSKHIARNGSKKPSLQLHFYYTNTQSLIKNFALYPANLRYPFAVEDQSDLANLVAALGLTPHPEGGFYRETYRTEQATAIYYLLTADTFSEMHRLDADEIYHFYAGDPVEILRLFPDGTSDISRLGNYLQGGEIPQLVVPKGVWQGSRLCTDGTYALMGTTMAPAFNLNGYEQGKAEQLIAQYAKHSTMIKELTRV